MKSQNTNESNNKIEMKKLLILLLIAPNFLLAMPLTLSEYIAIYSLNVNGIANRKFGAINKSISSFFISILLLLSFVFCDFIFQWLVYIFFIFSHVATIVKRFVHKILRHYQCFPVETISVH